METPGRLSVAVQDFLLLFRNWSACLRVLSWDCVLLTLGNTERVLLLTE